MIFEDFEDENLVKEGKVRVVVRMVVVMILVWILVVRWIENMIIILL